MRIGFRLFACVLLTVSLLATSCADPPTKEMNQAQGALDAARAAGAADYAADEFKAADAALARSRQAVTDRDYRQALNFALDARDRAQTAARLSADEKARVRTEADRALRAADAHLQRAMERLDAAITAKTALPTLAAPRGALDTARKTVDGARASFESGDYRAALNALTTANLAASLDTAMSEIDAAAAAKPARRPARRNR